MREIKFRAWDKYNKKMSYGEELETFNDDGYRLNFYYIDKEDGLYVGNVGPSGMDAYRLEVMQYTGLKDKNGKEIYEGDIIKYNFKSLLDKEGINRDRIAPVYWQEFRGCWAVKESRYCNNDLFTYVQNRNVVEVIGNIYENPELLEG